MIRRFALHLLVACSIALLTTFTVAQKTTAKTGVSQKITAQNSFEVDAASQDAAVQDAASQDRSPHAEKIRVRADVDSTRYRIGEWIVLQLNIAAPATWTLNAPVTDEDIVNGEFVAADEPEKSVEGERQQLRQRVTVTVFDTGRIALGAIVRYRVPGDTTTYTAASNSIDMRITTVELDTTQSFRDIKDVMDVSLTIWDYLMYAGIVLLAVLLLWFGRRWYRSRRVEEQTEEAPAVPELPAAVLALRDLETLRSQRLWQEGRHKTYQSRLTDILRNYIERRFEVPAMEHPTSEIMPDVAMLGLPTVIVDRLENVLQTADRTKFARYTPTSDEHESSMRFAVEFVESTRDDASAVEDDDV